MGKKDALGVAQMQLKTKLYVGFEVIRKDVKCDG